MPQQLIWQLSSSDGWDTLNCSSDGRSPDDNSVIGVSIASYGQFWDRQQLANSGAQRTALVADYDLRLPQVSILPSQLHQLYAEIDDWLASPRPIRVDLGEAHQAVRVQLDKQEHMISSLDRPVFELVYDTMRFCATIRFVTDQSCLRILRDGLGRWLSAY